MNFDQNLPREMCEKIMRLMKINEMAICDIGGCDSMRFVMVIWCDCSDGVLFNASNDQDNECIKRRLHEASRMLDFENNEPAGHA